MANRQREPVSYRKFQTEPVLADGLLAVARPGGDLLERASAGLFRLAAQQGEIADRQAARAGKLAGEQAAMAGRPDASLSGGAGGGAIGGDAHQVAAGILRKEEGFRATPYWDVNAWRTGYGSDTVTTADGRKVKVTEGMKITRADADRDLARRLGEFEHVAAGQAGAENWSKLPAATRGALLSVAYNYGSLPKSVVSAIKGGGDIAGAVEGLSANKKRRGREAAIIRGGGTPGGAAAGGEGGAPSFSVTGGNFRPSGSDTIYGRAFDEAGTKTYLQMVDTEMRSTIQQAFELYRDDPVSLEKGLGALKTALRKDHVFPEIAADFDLGFDALAARYMGQARENLAVKVKAQDRADFYERTNQLETDQQKMLADFDPKSGNAADALASAQGAIDAQYDSAVDRGLLDADDAAKAKITSRRGTALAFYGKQADSLDADGVATMREEMTKDFADGGIAGLDGDGWATLDARLQRLEKNKRGAQTRDENALRRTGDKMALQLQHGQDVNQADLSKLMLDAGTTPGGKEIVQETLAKISAGRAIRDFSLPEAAAHVAGLRKQYGDEPSAAQARTLAFAEKMLADKRDAIRTDSVTYAENNGIVPVTPFLTDAQTPEDLSATMAARTEAAEQAATELGAPVRYLKKGEAKAVGAAVRANPEAGAAMAGAIVAGAGNAAPKVLAEFGADAPMVAEAGAIVAFGGSAKAAEDVIAGYGKGPDGKQLKGLKPDSARTEFDSVAGGSLARAPKDRTRIERAAQAIAKTRIAEQGLDPTSDEARNVYAVAVQEAAGAVFDRGVQYGGFATVGSGVFSSGEKVLVPSEIRADRFEDVLGAITDADLKNLPHQPKAGRAVFGLFGDTTKPRSLVATLQDAVPVAVDGGYAFAAGDPASDDPQWIMGSDGKPFVLDIMAMRDRLAPRVPGAFR